MTFSIIFEITLRFEIYRWPIPSGKNLQPSVTNIIDTFMQFDSLEFTAHVEKSVLYPPKD